MSTEKINKLLHTGAAVAGIASGIGANYLLMDKKFENPSISNTSPHSNNTGNTTNTSITFPVDQAIIDATASAVTAGIAFLGTAVTTGSDLSIARQIALGIIDTGIATFFAMGLGNFVALGTETALSPLIGPVGAKLAAEALPTVVSGIGLSIFAYQQNSNNNDARRYMTLVENSITLPENEDTNTNTKLEDTDTEQKSCFGLCPR